MAIGVYEYGTGSKCVWMFKYICTWFAEVKMQMKDKERNRVNVFSMAKHGPQRWGCTKDRRTGTRHRHYQTTLRAMCSAFTYVARRPRIVAPARSTILRRARVLRSCLSIVDLGRSLQPIQHGV